MIPNMCLSTPTLAYHWHCHNVTHAALLTNWSSFELS